MTVEELIKDIRSIDISKGEVLIPGKAVYVKRKAWNPNTCKRDYIHEYVVLLNEGKKVGGILLMDDMDLFLVVFKRSRGKHYMSSFLKSGWIQKLSPTLKRLTTRYFPHDPEYEAVKHFAEILNVGFKSPVEKIERP